MLGPGLGSAPGHCHHVTLIKLLLSPRPQFPCFQSTLTSESFSDLTVYLHQTLSTTILEMLRASSCLVAGAVLGSIPWPLRTACLEECPVPHR